MIGSSDLPAGRFELGETGGGGTPGLNTGQDTDLIVCLPEKAEIPSKGFTNDLEDSRCGPGKRSGFDQNAGDRMFGGEMALDPFPLVDFNLKIKIRRVQLRHSIGDPPLQSFIQPPDLRLL